MAEDLPDEFDVVVIGTGMPESILAAAFARIGQSVLHIDRNPYYSGQWASFSLKTIEEWVQGLQKPEDKADIPEVKADEVLVDLHLTDDSYSKHKLLFHIGDPEPASEVNKEPHEEFPDNVQEVTEPGENKSDNAGKDQVISNKVETIESAEPTGALIDSKEQITTGNSSEDGTHIPQTSDSNDSNLDCENQTTEGNKTETTDPGTNNASENKSQMSVSSEQVTGWTESKLRKEWRKFNLDLSPKLLYCAGSMVELLITSDIAKYCEFKTVSRILTLIDGKLKRVPCSRADVFSSKDVSMIEKRMMMKFLTFCVNYDKHEEDYSDFVEKPYKEYLEHQKLSKNVIHFIQHAISMTNNSTFTPEGLKKTQKFLHSLGRYGNTAFLWPLYGSGEMPQSFCRMCAVFGGVYCLRTPAASLIVNSDNICTGVVMTTGKHIKCKRLVMETSYAPDSYIDRVSNRLVNRGILVTDKSIMSTDDPHQLSLLRIPDDGDQEHPATLLELPGSSMTCPPGLYVVHLTKEPKDDNQLPEESLQSAVTKLIKGDAKDDERPQVLLSVYFQQKINIGGQSDITPSNVILVPGPGPEIDIDQAVTIARKIFEEVMPGEDFLPRPPNPEDIIFVDEEETQITQDSEKTEFNETSQDFEDNGTKNESHETDQSEKCSESPTTDTSSEHCQKQADPNDQEYKANENSESVNVCKTEEQEDSVDT